MAQYHGHTLIRDACDMGVEVITEDEKIFDQQTAFHIAWIAIMYPFVLNHHDKAELGSVLLTGMKQIQDGLSSSLRQVRLVSSCR